MEREAEELKQDRRMEDRDQNSDIGNDQEWERELNMVWEEGMRAVELH